MKKILFLFSVLVLMSGSAIAGNNKTTVLKGQVIDKQGNPIVGAKVFLENIQTSVYTDFDGEFTISNVPKSQNTIQISMASYEDIKSNINLSSLSNEIISIQLRSK